MKFEYKFGNKIYTSFEELGKDISLSWELAKIQLYSGVFHKAVADIDPVLGNKIHVCQNIVSQDRGVFVLQYLFNCNLPFTYKGIVYDELSSIGKDILVQAPYVNKTIEEIIELGLIGDYMKLKEIDKNYSKHFKEVRELEDRFENESDVVYFLMGYLLSEDKGFIFDGKVFSDEKMIINYLTNNKKIEEFSAKNENIDYFIAWLEVQGHILKVKEWLEKISIIKSWK